MTDALFIRRLLIALGLVGLALLFWQLASLWVLIFGSILVAIILRSIAEPFEEYFSWSPHWSLATAGLLIILILALLFWLAGDVMGGQFEQLSMQIPQAWANFELTLQSSPIGSGILRWLNHAKPDIGILSNLSRITVGIVDSMAKLALVIFAGIYIAVHPPLYQRGARMLLPPNHRRELSETFDACCRALKLWLKGQLISMVLVGAVISVGLWLIGIPSALGLGLLAGAGEFVPFVGIALAFFPALLLAAAQGTSTVWWTAAVYIVALQAEGHVVMPLVQQEMIAVPPALLLFALLAFSMLFGPLGTVFAAPLAVATYVIVKKLYVRDIMGEKTSLPGEEAA